MDALEDQTHVLKGKRTKRQRPQSPIPFSISTAHSSSGNNGDNSNSATTVPAASPPTADSGESVTEEEEEMANCLILLAQGNFPKNPSSIGHDNRGEMGLKFASKRTPEEGSFGYQCKTCDRTFPSFQALGGHRASHKKSSNNKNLQFSDEEKDEQLLLLVKTPVSSPASNGMKLIRNGNSCGDLRGLSNKVHECSICGAEFASGQALGGHMRRHRAPVVLRLESSSGLESENCQQVKRARNLLSLDLDLNLPAPGSDHERESKFAFGLKQQQKQHQQKQQPPPPQQQLPLVLSTAPALVDCHY